MIPHHVYYQLAVIGFLWLCIMLHYTWPSRSAGSPQLPTESVPTKLKRTRTSEPKPFEGLTQRPLALHVNMMPPIPSRLRQDGLTLCRPPTDALVQSTPRCTFARMTAATIEAGWDWATSAPTVIPAVDPGDSCTAAPARVIFLRCMARFFMASVCRWS
jgi:hypothetical protein